MSEDFTPWPADVADRYRTDGVWEGTLLSTLPARWAETFADRTALVDGARRITFRELHELVLERAAGFAGRGLGPGDRVLLQLPNCAEFVVTFFALIHAGAQPVFSLASHRSHELGHLARISGARAYIAPWQHQGFGHAELGAALRRDHGVELELYLGAPEDLTESDLELVRGDTARRPAALAPGEPAFFLLSGGTTALPKLIPRTHDDYLYQLRRTADVCGVTGDDAYLVVLPIEFNFAWGCPGVLGVLNQGGKAVLAPGTFLEDCRDLAATEGVTFTSVVPTIARLWTEQAAEDGTTFPVRFIQIGGARLEPDLAATVEDTLDVRLQQVFGMAEGLLCMTDGDSSREQRIHTQGRPVSPHDDIRIESADGTEAAPGESGELLTRGPYTLRGYFRAREHNARAFTSDGYYRSGDLARRRTDGSIVVTGRLKDVIIRGGEKISAPEVEAHLTALPQVRQAAVLPIPDTMLGERTLAVVVASEPAPTLQTVRQQLMAREISTTKLPDRVETVEVLPLTPLGKVDKKALAARFVQTA
ncbi:(2,3-dihydroxybenzoyl)adenylate synthase [Myceligenerans cantabricum]